MKRGWRWGLPVGILLLALSWGLFSGVETNAKDAVDANQPRQKGEFDLIIEYYDDPNTFFAIEVDVSDYWSATDWAARERYTAGLDYSRYFDGDHTKRVLQICVISRTCGDGTTEAANHFDGSHRTTFDFSTAEQNRAYGGRMLFSHSNYTSKAWIKQHPQANHLESRISLLFQLSDNDNSDLSIKRVDLFIEEVGFVDIVPNAEPRMGFWDQLLISWDDAVRYQPNSDGLVIANSSGEPTSSRLGVNQRWSSDSGNEAGYVSSGVDRVYRVLYSTNTALNKNSPLCSQTLTQGCWHWEEYALQSRLTADSANRSFQATVGDYTVENGTKTPITGVDNLLDDLFNQGDDLVIRMWMKQRRFNQEYTDISDPLRYNLPTNFQVAEQTSQGIELAFRNTYNQPIDRYEYRIGHTEGTLQTTWTTDDWIEVCGADMGTETINNQQHQTLTITSPQPKPGDCGGDPGTPLTLNTPYQIQLRAVDESRVNPIARNYLNSNKITLTPPTTMAPSTMATTPSTAAPTQTTPTNPTNTQPSTPTFPPNTQPSTPPATQPPDPSGGDGPNVNITGDNNTVIIGDGNTITFTDTSGSVHQTNIVQLADMGVTRGCNPPENSRFCPDRAVTRAEMATFLVRAFDLPPTDEDPFTDTTGNVHSSNINRMAAAGVSRGCNPPTNDRFCPNRAVTRAEMATFMTRVLQLSDRGDATFQDTSGNIHTPNIQRFTTAGITRGCNPPTNNRYCPDRAVTRGEMATFLVRSTALNSG